MVDYNYNRKHKDMIAKPELFPQGRFKPKPCKMCGTEFEPQAPSHLFCSQECADRQANDRYLKREYGISIEDYEELCEEQSNRCAICGGEGFLMDKKVHRNKLVVDHCHESGEVRGLLCHNCNRALGLLKDSVSSLTKAIQYLRRCNDYPEKE